MDTGLRVTDLLLELQRAQIVETLRPPLAGIESLHKRKNVPARLVPSVIRLVMDELILQGTEETLGHRVVLAMAFAAHARGDAECRTAPLICETTVLCPLIGVMNQPGRDSSLARRHGQCVERELWVRLVTHGPADHPPRISIQQDRHIEPADSRGHHRDIADPDAIEPGRLNALL